MYCWNPEESSDNCQRCTNDLEPTESEGSEYLLCPNIPECGTTEYLIKEDEDLAVSDLS